MGNSVSVSIYYGIDLELEDGELPEFLGDEEDIEDYIIAKYHPELSILNMSDDYEDELWKKRDAFIRDCPVELQYFNHCEYNETILTVKGFGLGSYDASFSINPNDLAVDPQMVEKAKAWCAKEGIDFEDPEFIVCGYYG